MTDYTQLIKISSDHENAVESFIHEIIKQSDNAGRYGVHIEVRRVDEGTEHNAEFKQAATEGVSEHE